MRANLRARLRLPVNLGEELLFQLGFDLDFTGSKSPSTTLAHYQLIFSQASSVFGGRSDCCRA
jgi:hypothetical protein